MNRIARLRRGQEGFTLIELLVVVAIIALLATFAVPKLFDAINKSKKAPGDADMNTLSSAMERYYFENHTYPTGADATDIADALKGGFVKSNTTFQNGFKKGYVYFTNAGGTFYVLVDPRNYTGNMYVTCGTWTSPTAIAAGSSLAFAPQGTAPAAADLNAGCTAHSATPTAAANRITDVGIITN